MEPAKAPDLTTKLFGLELSTPVVLSPTGFADLACPDGQLEAARAASKRNALLILSHCSCATMERVVAEGGDGPKMVQIFPWKAWTLHTAWTHSRLHTCVHTPVHTSFSCGRTAT